MKNGNPSGASEFLVDEWGKEVHRGTQMRKPTRAQIEKEIRALDNCRKFIPRFTAFGEDNFAVLDAGMSALADRLSVDLAYDMAAASGPTRIDEARIEAALWMAGESEESPADGWQMFRAKTQG